MAEAVERQNNAINAPSTLENSRQDITPSTGLSCSRVIRRLHMFAGLFLGPWMLMYALSTLVMTHRNYVLSFYASKSPALTTERELDYARSFPTNVGREEIARQILSDLGVEGRHSVSGGRDGKPLVINRQQALVGRRITFNPAEGKIIVAREEFRALTFLERMHRRRGYDQPYLLEDTWGFTVDVAVVCMIFWSLSGLWLWWELRTTHGWGTFCLVAGLALFAVFLVLL